MLQNPSRPRPSGPRAALVAPTLLRALVTLAFAASTIFIEEPSLGLGLWLAALWLAGVGAAHLWGSSRTAAHRELIPGALASLPRTLGMLALLAAAALVVVPSAVGGMALILGPVLLVHGLLEAWLGRATRAAHPLGRDHLITGAVTAAAGLGVVLVMGLDVHAVLGVAGGAAVICGVDLLIAALSLRHDARVD